MSGPDGMQNLSCDEVRDMAGAYVLGALEADEAAAVLAHLAAHPDGHPEIEELGAVIPALAELAPVVEPPEGIKTRILAAAAADLAARGSVPETPAVPVAFPGPAERGARRARTSPAAWALRIAAVLAIALLGGWNLLLQNELGAARQYEQQVAAVLEVASQPGSLTAVLAADGGTGSGLAAVGGEGDLALAMRDLAPTSGTSVYETWVIGEDGVPVPLGSFTVGGNGTAFFETAGLPSTEGIVLALTLEPGPGATTPTLPIISAGVAGAPG